MRGAIDFETQETRIIFGSERKIAEIQITAATTLSAEKAAQYAQHTAELEARVADAALHEAMLESLPHKVFCKDLDGRFVMVNAEFAKLFGLKPADFVGKTDFDFVSHEMATKYRADDQRVVRSRTPVTLIEPNEMGAVKRFVPDPTS